MEPTRIDWARDLSMAFYLALVLIALGVALIVPRVTQASVFAHATAAGAAIAIVALPGLWVAFAVSRRVRRVGAYTVGTAIFAAWMIVVQVGLMSVALNLTSPATAVAAPDVMSDISATVAKANRQTLAETPRERAYRLELASVMQEMSQSRAYATLGQLVEAASREAERRIIERERRP